MIFGKKPTKRSINYLRSEQAENMSGEKKWWNDFEELERDIEQIHDSDN